VPILSRRAGIWPAVAVCVLAACTGDPTPPASGDPAGTSMVIAIADEPVSVHPLAGYAEHGAAKIFDGLVEHRANSSLRPALAVELPEPAPDGKSWTARLREGVTFSDGTAFDATDVVATYRALLDPAYASPVRQRFWMLGGVRELDPRTVRFELSRPYAPFPQLLVLGILPSEALTRPGPVTESGPPPAGTGPYKVTEWSPGQRMVLEVNKSYFDGPPAITRLTVEFLPDDDARARRMRDGKLDGVALPPALAKTFESQDGLRVVAHSAADLHGIALPPGDPATGDPALRLALNYGIDRKVLVDGVLGGMGTEASTPVPEALAEFVEPTAKFPYDVTKALDLLGEAGWLPGSDGMRARAGVPARFTLLYRSGDTLARDLASAFSSAAKGIGIQVSAEAADADTLLSRSTKDAVLFGFGNPFDPDLGLYELMHSSAGQLGANPTIDAALDTGRTVTDPAQRATAYRKLQRTYLTAPSMVVLAAPQHTYVLRESWTGYEPVIDAQDPDATWGAWWNVHKWTPR
jgi:peptide/nickel transport system substrate-binding protein